MSRELKVVWEPENRFGELDFEKHGVWATLFSTAGPLGRLHSDCERSLGYMGFGDSRLAARARENIQFAADVKLPAGEAYEFVLQELLSDSAVWAEQASGLLSGILESPTGEAS